MSALLPLADIRRRNGDVRFCATSRRRRWALIAIGPHLGYNLQASAAGGAVHATFDARHIAIMRSFGEYSVYSQFDGSVDQRKFRECTRVADISWNPGYRDFAGIFSREEIPKFGPNEPTLRWLSRLPADIEFIMVVLEEWESGL
jgi:hypothetical protein